MPKNETKLRAHLTLGFGRKTSIPVICSETVGKIIAFAFDKKLNNLTLDKAIETHMGIVSITAYAYTDATAKMRNRDAQKPTGTA